MRVVFFGTGDFGLPSLEILNKAYSLVAVVSTPDKPSGRKLKTQPSPVKQWAMERDIRCLDYSKDDLSALPASLKELRPDLLVVIDFGGILKPDFLTLPRLYALNIHASLLPKYRGASPMQQSLLNGDNETGISVIRMVERLDAGDVLLQKKTVLGPDENILQLKTRLSILGAEALAEAVGAIERGNAHFTVQQEDRASYAKKISKADGKIDWNMPAARLHDRVRAFLGWPGCYFFFKGKRILVWKSRVALSGVPDGAKKPGIVQNVSGANGLLVAAGDGSSLFLEELQLEAKKPLSWKDFSKGFSIQAGDIFE